MEDKDNDQAEQFDPALDAQQAASVKETIERLGLTFKSAIEQAGVSHSAGYQWITQANNTNISHPSIRAAARTLIEWHTTAEKDANDAAAVRQTMQRLGLTVSVVSVEAKVGPSQLSTWLSRKELAKPGTQEAAAALVIWNETASLRPIPEFDEEQDSQNAAAVSFTIQRLGLSVKQAAEQAAAATIASKQWLTRTISAPTTQEYIRIAAHRLILWNESAKLRPSKVAPNAPPVPDTIPEALSVPESELLRRGWLSKFSQSKGEIQAVRGDDTQNPLVQQLAALFSSTGKLTQFNHLQAGQVTFIILLKRFARCNDSFCAAQQSAATGLCIGCKSLCCALCSNHCSHFGKTGHQIKNFDGNFCAHGKPLQGNKTGGETCHECEVRVISAIGVSVVQNPNNRANCKSAACILLCAWITADPWMYCACEETLISVLRGLRSVHAPKMKIFRSKWSGSCLSGVSSRVVWDEPSVESPFGSLCYQESMEWTDEGLKDRDKLGNIDSLLLAIKSPVATVDPSLLGCTKAPINTRCYHCKALSIGQCSGEKCKNECCAECGKSEREDQPGILCFVCRSSRGLLRKGPFQKPKLTAKASDSVANTEQSQISELIKLMLSTLKPLRESSFAQIKGMPIEQQELIVPELITQLGKKLNPKSPCINLTLCHCTAHTIRSCTYRTCTTYAQLRKIASQLHDILDIASVSAGLKTMIHQMQSFGLPLRYYSVMSFCGTPDLWFGSRSAEPSQQSNMHSVNLQGYSALSKQTGSSGQRVLDPVHNSPTPKLDSHPVKNGVSVAGFDKAHTHLSSLSSPPGYPQQQLGVSGMPNFSQCRQQISLGGFPQGFTDGQTPPSGYYTQQHPPSTAGSPPSAISGYGAPPSMSSPSTAGFCPPTAAAGSAAMVRYNQYMQAMYSHGPTATGGSPPGGPAGYNTGLQAPNMGVPPVWSPHRRKAAALLAGTAYTPFNHGSTKFSQDMSSYAPHNQLSNPMIPREIAKAAPGSLAAAGYPGQTAAGLLSLQSASIANYDQPAQQSTHFPTEMSGGSQLGKPGLISDMSELNQHTVPIVGSELTRENRVVSPVLSLAQENRVAERWLAATASAAQHSTHAISNGSDFAAGGLPPPISHGAGFQSTNVGHERYIASSLSGNNYNPPSLHAKDHMLTCADGVSRLWSVLCEMQPGENISEQTTTMLGDCSVKLVAMLHHSYDTVGCTPGSSLSALPGQWTVRSLAAMSIAKLLWLKGEAQGRGSFIYDRMIQAQPLEQLVDQLNSLLQLPVNNSDNHKLLVVNRQYGAMSVLHSLLCHGCDDFAIGEAVIPAVLDALTSYMSQKIDSVLPAQLVCAVELLNLLSKESRNASLLRQLEALGVIHRCQAISQLCRLDKQTPRWDECLMQVLRRIKANEPVWKENTSSELSKSSSVPEQIDVSCNGVPGKFILTVNGEQLVQTKDGKLLTPCAFEIKAGSKSKNWKTTIKRVDTGESVYSWLRKMLAVHRTKEPAPQQPSIYTKKAANVSYSLIEGKLVGRTRFVGRGKTKSISCDVCRLTAEVDEQGADEWVVCRKCALSVHVDCYCASPDIEDARAWLCDRCAQGARNAICNICAGRAGGMKRVQGVTSVKPIDIVCNGVAGQFCTEQQLVITASGEMLTPSHFEAQAGSKSKNWKTSIRRADNGKSVFESLATAWPWAHVRCTLDVSPPTFLNLP